MEPGTLLRNNETGELAVWDGERALPVPEEIARSSGLLESALHGATMGFSDELQAGARTLAGKVGLADPLSYEQNRLIFDAMRQKYARENPWKAGIADVGAAIASPINRVIGAVAGIGKLPTIMQSGLGGAIGGGLYGAGAADPGERAAGAAFGGTVGGAVGAAAPPLMRGAIAGSAALRNMLSDVPVAERKAYERFGKAMGQDDVTRQQMAQNIDRLGDEAMLADVGGTNVQRLGRDIYTMPGPARNIADRELNARDALARPAMMDRVRRLFGVQDDYLDQMDDLLATREAQANRMYPEIYDSPVQVNKTLANLLNRPFAKKAKARLKTRMLDRGYNADDVEAILGRDIVEGDTLSLRVLDQWKQQMDDIWMPQARSGAKGASDLGNIVRQVRTEVDRVQPKYKTARDAYAGSSRMIEALEEGKRFTKLYPEEIAKKVRGMTASEREMYLNGAARELTDMLERGVDASSPKQLIAKNPKIRRQIEALFGDDAASYREFIDEIDRWSAFKETKKGVQGGSDTASKIAGQEDLAAGDLISAGSHLARGNIVDAGKELIATLLAKRRQFGIDDKTARELSRIMFTRGKDANREILRRMQEISPRLPPEAREKILVMLGRMGGTAAAASMSD